MSHVALNPGFTAVPAPLSGFALRRWLWGHWGLLFSHPDDFVCRGFESDRWLVHVQEAFAATGVRPLLFGSSQASWQECLWIHEIGGRVATLAISEIARYPVARGSVEAQSRAVVFEGAARFVMTLDDSLRLRHTFVYTLQDRLPSPMDLAALARALRDASAARKAAAPAMPFKSR